MYKRQDLDASEIEARLGATWISEDYITRFMAETFHTPRYYVGSKMCIRDRDGGITVEDAKAPQKKENNAEVHRPPVGQMTEREVLDDEE